VLVRTIHRDGTPTISPVEPFVMDGDLWLIMMWRSTMAIDLTRDPRILVHSVITSRDGGEGEYKVRGTVHSQTDVAAQRRFADSVEKSLGWLPEPGRFHLFAVDIDQIIFIRYDDASGDQFVACWPKEREFVRRGTSATTLGYPEPVTTSGPRQSDAEPALQPTDP
jgi:hypothetical protein